MIPNNAANYAANIKDTFIDTRSCASAKLPSQARARGGGEIRIRRGIRIKQKHYSSTSMFELTAELFVAFIYV